MYESAFAEFFKSANWATLQGHDRNQFFRALDKVVRHDTFNASDLKTYLAEESFASVPNLGTRSEFDRKVDIYIDVVKAYIEALETKP